ncbi:MAG TPA: hypothetical protein VMG12_23770 [Polyangiaceae bacterium]|nr:hypothetical protein [Polyangiaceae bacterium]
MNQSRLGRGAVAVGLFASGCTIANDVNDDPEGNAAANMYLDGPSERSLSLWAAPGDNLLAALAEVEANDADVVLPVDNRVLGSFFGELGAYFSATTKYTPFSEALKRQTMDCESSRLPDAIETLCAQIAEPRRPSDESTGGAVQLVLVNELQHVAYQRSLVRQLLQCSWDAGFRYLGIEALEEDDAALEARGFVSKTASGALMREPQMARLVEDGLALGYDLVSFDVAGRCTDCRLIEAIEQYSAEQATNLIAKTFGVDPEAKVLVLTNARQAYKRIWGPAPYITSLGGHVWEQSGVEPFAIEQVAVDRPSPQFGASESPPSGMYGLVWDVDARCMGSYAQGSPTGMANVDGLVIHVPPQDDADRWGWVHAPADERRTLTATCASCSAGERLLLQAFAAGSDRSDRVPIDQALCSVGQACQLALPAAVYDVVVWNESAEVGVATADLQTNANAAIDVP